MKKLAIIYGELVNGVQKKAVEVLTEVLLDYTYEYPVCLSWAQAEKWEQLSKYRCIYIGTKENQPYIQTHSKEKLFHKEEYAIRVEQDTVMIEGYDDAGVLYGCIDFYNKFILKYEYPHNDRYRVNFFEKELPDFYHTSYPSVKDRGIWTWGHVIYDYRGFIDHMVKLKMNTLIVWNDFVPVNGADMVAYAHNCGVKVIWGYAWCWDTDCSKFSMDQVNDCAEEIFEKYEQEYAQLGGDGIYFQSFTELNTETIGGVLIAEAVTAFVNKTAAYFYEKYPDLEIQFGLHANSVKEKLSYIQHVDPRMRIVWENCGSFPFSYIPKDVEKFAETKEFVDKIAVLRGEGDHFGVVTKGLTKLDWSAFEHLGGPIHVGASSEFMKRDRVTRKHKIWKYIQAYWITNADKAYEMVQQMTALKQGDLYVTALVEDGMFEETIMYPVALYSEMLWDCEQDLKEMMSEVALREYVDFA